MRSGCCVIKRMLIVTAVAVVTEDRSRDLSLSQEDEESLKRPDGGFR